MTSTVSFPGLGLEFTINSVAFRLFGMDVYWYGILIAFGVLCGILLAIRNADRLGLDEDKLFDVIIIGVICAVLGGRTFFIVFNENFSVHSIKEFFNIRGGGTAFYGVLLGALISSFVVCKIEKIRYTCLVDNLALGLLIGQGIGRWGNFMNQELFGTNTDLPWGMYSDTIAAYIARNSSRLYIEHGIVLKDGPVHPTGIYESIWCFIGVFVIWKVMKNRRFDGQVFLTYLIWNGIGRGFCEHFRTDALFLGRIRISQFVCVSLAVFAAVTLLVIFRKIKYEGDDEYLKCYALTEEWAEEKRLIAERANAKKNKKAKESAETAEPAEETSVNETEEKELSAEEMMVLAAASQEETVNLEED